MADFTEGALNPWQGLADSPLVEAMQTILPENSRSSLTETFLLLEIITHSSVRIIVPRQEQWSNH
jgi:hypothetical protein